MNNTQMKIPMLDLMLEYDYMKEEIDEAIKNCLSHHRWILGPEVSELEEKVANYLGAGHCTGVSSGTDALLLALRAMAIKTKGQEFFNKSDEIITTPFTFNATAGAILLAGATPVFVDIDANSYNISPTEVKRYMESGGSNVVGIMPVHLYGQACDMDEVMSIAEERGLFVVEDAAQAFGGKWEGQRLGTIGAAGCFSFFPSKNLGGFGDGGMVSTSDDEVAEIVRMLLKHGGKDKHEINHIGYNARLDTFQAAILLVKLKHIDRFNEKRRAIASMYNEGFKDVDGITTPAVSPDAYHVYHQYTVKVKNRDAVNEYLDKNGVSSVAYYSLPLYGMKAFHGKCKVFGNDASRDNGGELKNVANSCPAVLSLPIEPLQDEGTTKAVIETLKRAVERC